MQFIVLSLSIDELINAIKKNSEENLKLLKTTIY
jgi:hypothetical protein